MSGDDHLLDDRGGILNFDLLALRLCLEPFAAEFILCLPVGCFAQVLDIEILNVRETVGETPGQLFIMTGDHQGQPREGHAGDMQVIADEMVFKPDGWSTHAKMHIVCQDRHAGLCAAAGNEPSCCCQFPGGCPGR